MTQLWQRADAFVSLPECPDHQTKNIFFARKYSAWQGYSFSETNHLINNLKKDPKRQDLAGYKSEAIERFAQEASVFLNNTINRSRAFVLIPMPPSKTEAHPDYDNRIERVAKRIVELCPQNSFAKVLRAKLDVQPSHHGGARDANTIETQMEVIATSLTGVGGSLIIIDDVLTKGGHYEAARRHLLRTLPGRIVSGLFWAKTE